MRSFQRDSGWKSGFSSRAGAAESVNWDAAPRTTSDDEAFFRKLRLDESAPFFEPDWLGVKSADFFEDDARSGGGS